MQPVSHELGREGSYGTTSLTADWLLVELHRRRAQFARFNTEDYPSDVTLGWSPDGHGTLGLPDGDVALGDVRAVWFRRPLPPAPPNGVDEELAAWTVRGWCEVLGRCDDQGEQLLIAIPALGWSFEAGFDEHTALDLKLPVRQLYKRAPSMETAFTLQPSAKKSVDDVAVKPRLPQPSGRHGAQ